MKKKLFIKLLVIFLVLITLNFLSYLFFFRIDFTADKSYTLSNATKSILKQLKQPITINAYFSNDLPTQLIKSKKDFEELLIEYKKRSKGKVTYTFANPNENEAEEKLAQAQGIRPVMVNVSERDQVKQLRAYMGATIGLNEQKEIIPVIQPGEDAEYNLTTAIKKLTIQNKQKIAFIQGHGEHSSNECQQLLQQLSINYEVEDYTINDTTEIPVVYKSVILFNSKDSIPPQHFKKLDNYLSTGGNILLGYNGLYAGLNEPVVQPLPDNGIKTWLSQKGIIISGQVVTDVQCRNISVQQQAGDLMLNRPIKFPYFPIIKKFGAHPVTKGIEAVFFPFLSSIETVQKNAAVAITPLAFSSKRSGLVKVPLMVDINKEWSVKDFNRNGIIIAAALEGPIAGTAKSKIIVIANGNFAANSEPGQSELNSDNINFAANAIDWLSDDTGLIELRTKAVTSRPLEQPEESTKNLIKYINVLSPMLLVILIGVTNRYRSRRKRKRLAEVNY
jgi:gliding-associated putative ABC transporter substrate-binding component GldG